MGLKNKAIIIIIFSYMIIHSIMCSPMAITSQAILDESGIDSQIAVSRMIPEKSYTHIFIIINGEPYEPRYAGLFLRSNVDYDNPRLLYDSVEDYVEERKIFNTETLIKSVQEVFIFE